MLDAMPFGDLIHPAHCLGSAATRPLRCSFVTTLSEGFGEGVSDYSWAAVPVGRVVTGSE